MRKKSKSLWRCCIVIGEFSCVKVFHGLALIPEQGHICFSLVLRYIVRNSTNIRELFLTQSSIVSLATYRKVDDLSQGILESVLWVMPPELTKEIIEKNHQRILAWLGNPCPPRSSSALFDSACPGTGQWLLAHEEYLKWRDGYVSFLWCYGKRMLIYLSLLKLLGC